MNILMVYHRLPFPPNKGEKMRAWQQVKYLAARHSVWLACFVDSAEDWEHVPVLEACCERVTAVPLDRRIALTRGAFGLLRGRSLTDGFYGSRAMQRVVDAFAGDTHFDVAFAFSSSMGAYIENVPAGRRVLDMNDFDSCKWRGYADGAAWPLNELYRTEAKRLARRECELVDRCDLTLLVNHRECQRCPDPQLHEKLDALCTPMDLERYADIRGLPPHKTVGYTGTLNYRPNVEAVKWFADDIWPQVRARHADAEYFIIGRRPPRDIRQLAERPGIHVTGAVDDIGPWLKRLRVFAASARTDIGVQTKVLEALAAGRPTVITEGGHQGIRARDGRDYVVAKDTAAFAAGVSDLLDDPMRCVAMSGAAVDFARRQHSVDVIMPRFEALLLGTPVPLPEGCLVLS